MPTYQFPKNRSQFEYITDPYHLLQKISSAKKKQERFEKQMKYGFKLAQNDQVIFAKCFHCSAWMGFRRKNPSEQKPIYALESFYNSHRHSRNKLQIDSVIDIAQKVAWQKKCIDKQASEEYLLKKIECSHFRLTEAKKKLEQIKSIKEPNFEDMTQLLNKDYYAYKYLPTKKKLPLNFRPQTFFTASPLMNSQYQKYGNCVYVKIYQNLCLEKPKNFGVDSEDPECKIETSIQFKEQYFLVVFWGLNHQRKIVVFGFATVSDQSQQTLSNLFNMFLADRQKFSPNTFIVDFTQKIEKGISLFQKENKREKIHFIFNAKSFLSDLKFENQQTFKEVYEIICAQTKNQYDIKSSKLRGKLSFSQLFKLEKIVQYQNRLCLSCIPETFIHTSDWTNFIEKLERLKHSQLSYSSTLINLIERSKDLFEQINFESLKRQFEKEVIPYDQIYKLTSLTKCRQMLPDSVFEQILQQSSKMHLNLIELHHNDTQYKITNIKFEESFSLNKNNFQCSCNFYSQTYLPCSHLISVCQFLCLDLYDLIDRFYRPETWHNVQKKVQQIKCDPKIEEEIDSEQSFVPKVEFNEHEVKIEADAEEEDYVFDDDCFEEQF